MIMQNPADDWVTKAANDLLSLYELKEEIVENIENNLQDMKLLNALSPKLLDVTEKIAGIEARLFAR